MNVRRYNEIAQRKGLTQKLKGTVTSIHGMNARGAWQKDLEASMQDAGFRYRSMDYGWQVARVLWPPSSGHWATRFADEFHRDQIRAHPRHSVIAHSFGTLILARALELHPDLEVHRAILFGSIVPRGFDWPLYCGRQQIGDVLNERCPHDWPVKACRLIPGAGPSGAYGFTNPCPHLVETLHLATGHSGLQHRLHYEKTWVPFLLRGRPAIRPHHRA